MGMQGGCVVVQAGAAPLRSWVHPLLLGREEEYDPEEDFEVDKLLDHRQCKGRREYLVRWVGTDPAGSGSSYVWPYAASSSQPSDIPSTSVSR